MSDTNIYFLAMNLLDVLGTFAELIHSSRNWGSILPKTLKSPQKLSSLCEK